MAEEKNKVGRPKIEKTEPLVDEKAEVLMMSESSDQTIPAGQAQEPIINNDKIIHVEDLSQKYINLLGKVKGTHNNDTRSLNFFSDLRNPFVQNQRLKRMITLPGNLDKSEVIDAVKDVGNNELLLRSAVSSLSGSNYLFYKILRESADIPLFKYFITPPTLEKSSERKSERYQKERKLVHDWIREFSVVNTFNRIGLEVKKDGKAAYSLRNSYHYNNKNEIDGVNYAYLQKLPTDYIKITYLGKLGYGVSFNMMWFFTPGTNPKQFDPYIQQVWEDMNNTGVIVESKKKMKQLNPFLASAYKPLYKGKQMDTLLEKTGDVFYYWVTLPPEVAFVFCSDLSNAYQAPDTAGLILDLLNLTAFTDTSALLATSPLVKFLTAEVEIQNNSGVGRSGTYISADLLDALNAEFDNKVSDNVTSFFAPLKNFHLHSLDTSSVNSSEILATATNNFLTRAGSSSTIPATDKPSVYAIKVAVKELASQYDSVTRQFERVMNFILKKMLGFSYEWRIHIFGDIFSIEEEKSFLKECVAGGSMYFLPKLLACEDIDMLEADAIVDELTVMGLYNKLATPTMIMNHKLGKETNKTSEDEDEMATGKKKVGRPVNNDPDSDSTEESRDRGDDISEIKNEYFAEEKVMQDIEEHKCILCHRHLDYDERDNKICEECRETFEIPFSGEE